MKKIIALILICLLCTPAQAGSSIAPALYEYADGDPYTISEERIVDFDGLFTLKLPDSWQRYVIGSTQAEQGVFVMFGDGTTFMTVERADISGEYADTAAYCLYLQENGRADAFLTAFGGPDDPEAAPEEAAKGADFVLYSDLEAGKAMCATVIPENGVYIFSFSPLAADMDAGQVILDLMESFTPTEAE